MRTDAETAAHARRDGNRLSVVLPDPADTGFSVRCDCLARNAPARAARAGDGTWSQGCQRPYGRLIRTRISAGMSGSSVRAAARVKGQPLITYGCASSWPAAGRLDPAPLERFPGAFRAVQADLRAPVRTARGIRPDLRPSSSRRQPVRCRSSGASMATDASSCDERRNAWRTLGPVSGQGKRGVLHGPRARGLVGRLQPARLERPAATCV